MKHTSVILTGLESAGKSTLFRGLTGQVTGDEANFRGSTVTCRRCRLSDCQCEIVDTPGIRLSGDSHTTQQAMAAMTGADVVLMVARGTHAVSEVETLLTELNLQHHKTALAITFQDRASTQIETLAQVYRQRLGIPVVIVNARLLDATARAAVLQAVSEASVISPQTQSPLADQIPVIEPQLTVFERPHLGPWLALLCTGLMFLLPVYGAYLLASVLQPLVDAQIISPLKAFAEVWPQWLQITLTGDYGLLTLGSYSFLWAFPVVVFIGISVAVVEETGLKDRITAALDPWLRSIGLSGRDLLPVLTGFGCKVVAVFQTRACSRCTRSACVSLIGFGSACSYQIGASLSLFGSAGSPHLFIPYLGALFIIGALHTRIWHGSLPQTTAQPLHERAFLQRATLRAISWRVRASIWQFLTQAMPIFLGICLMTAWLHYWGAADWLTKRISPALSFFNLPGETAPGILFSIFRKDGLLILNTQEGQLLSQLSTGQVFVLVWLASTLTACSVTLWTIRKELGWKAAGTLASRQIITTILSTALFAWILI